MKNRSAVLVLWGLIGLVGAGAIYSVIVEISDGNFVKATLAGIIAVVIVVVVWRSRPRPL